MYVQDERIYQEGWGVDVFLADGDSHGGVINEGLLTRVKIPKDKYILIGNNVITDRVLKTSVIFRDADEHAGSVERCLRKAKEFASDLENPVKKDRYNTMASISLGE